MAKPGAERSSLTRNVTGLLRAEIFLCKDGELIGSEDELVARMGVSRPTFRQAAKIVEQERILRIKRGQGGGYFASRPSPKAVAHMAAVFLQGRDLKLRDVIVATGPLFIGIARLAARRADRKPLQPLRDFIDSERGKLDQPFDNVEFLASERLFTRLYAPLGGNAMLELFYLTAFDFAANMTHETVYDDPKHVRVYRQLRFDLSQAILRGDADVAELLAARANQALLVWIMRAQHKDHKSVDLIERSRERDAALAMPGAKART